MNLHFILGDQLNQKISCLEGFNPEKDMIFMCEVWEEATYVKHHKKKIAFIFSAMRHFAKELLNLGYQLRYTKLDDAKNKNSFVAPLGVLYSFKFELT